MTLEKQPASPPKTATLRRAPIGIITTLAGLVPTVLTAYRTCWPSGRGRAKGEARG